MMEFDGIWMFFFTFGFWMLDSHGFSDSWILDDFGLVFWIFSFGV